ncbi:MULTISPECIES: 50S ribosomal protein L11 methyltransferase [Sphingobacterium]|jgi:ribosomal protein L11 methyltransferase|uniref:Ribosomal protein L11 methyltransferase n=1 Tax=Sphingobacterium kitahiroshimense TaxID=470446 RepID=A0ABV0BLJ5_9SPHI|nr:MULTISPECIES: 50S ribosomal protein L11 methyltransferase [unclassified Sphingobacterium]MBB2952367.1 ribosomal protein L11 methyltransferase [Sphingobacterium sp. JUb56]MCS3553618.1 ribosomal protein L11 methyltransferase [Sphingobacterium sp. JUb21]TCR01541.1 ribosomal protein L11 methyltransferase [Sphingobacterium sp. JUb20]
MKYSEVIFTRIVGEEWQQDLFIAELADIGFDTFEDTETGFAAFIPTANLDLQALETVILQQEDGFEVRYEVVDIQDQNWNKLWESNFSPILIDNDCYVRANFHPAKPEIRYEIIIDPKMSFGTGHHQTTTMILRYILENNFQDKEVLDMGCGTGILAILASQKEARHVFAVDFDDVCIASVEENKLLNNVSNIESKLGSYETIIGREFDIILANINRNILLEQFPQYSKSLRLNGELYISGFFDGEDLSILRTSAEAVGFEFVSNKVMDNWCSAKFVKVK